MEVSVRAAEGAAAAVSLSGAAAAK
jgi:hypothetical protein